MSLLLTAAVAFSDLSFRVFLTLCFGNGQGGVELSSLILRANGGPLTLAATLLPCTTLSHHPRLLSLH